jgi:glutamate-1-semialdehyde 2,1-aminomutase
MTEIATAYAARNPASAALWERAQRSLPGGDTRTSAYFRPYPLAIVSGDGPYLWDADGNRYVDLVSNGLSLIHGHRYRPAFDALVAACGEGSVWTGPTAVQLEMAEELCARTRSFEQVRFANTGSEAGILAAKVARRATGRPLLLKAWWGYHGCYDDLEAALHDNGELEGRTLAAPYGDADAFERVLAERGEEIAAVVIEPATINGVIPAPEGFVARLREATRRAGALLILDECITYRSAVGGMQEVLGVQPDLTMLGKFLGGGFPLSAVGGRADLLEVLDPSKPGRIYHGGSFNGNRLACTTGLVTVRHLDAAAIARMNAQAEEVEQTLVAAAAELELPVCFTRHGSMLSPHFFTEQPEPRREPADREATSLFHLAGTMNGLYLGPGDALIVLNTAVTDEALAQVKQGLVATLAAIAPHVRELTETLPEAQTK